MSTKGRDTGMKEKRGRSPTLPRKVGVGQQETKGRSPSLPKKTEIGQRKRPINPPSILERKKASTAVESKKVPTVPWPSTSLSRGSSARNPTKKLSPPKLKSLTRSIDRPKPPSKVMSTKSKSNPKNVIASSTKTSGSMKPKGPGTTRSPLKLKNSINVKETNVRSKKQTIQTTKDLESTIMAIEKKPVVSDAPSLSKNDHDIVTPKEHNGSNDILFDEVKFEDGGEIRVCNPSDSVGLVGDQDVSKSEICCDDNVSFDGSIDNKHIYDHDGCINQQDQVDETFDIISNRLDHPIVDQENQESENEQAAQEIDVGSIDEIVEAKYEDIEETKLEESKLEQRVEPEYLESEETNLEELKHEETNKLVHKEDKLEEPEQEESDVEEAEHDETKSEEPETKEDDVEAPTDEDTTSNVVIKSQQVVVHGKKDIATYNDVIEETVSKLREQRKNRVLALAGAFETVISLESDSSPKDLSPAKILSPKNLSPKYN